MKSKKRGEARPDGTGFDDIDEEREDESRSGADSADLAMEELGALEQAMQRASCDDESMKKAEVWMESNPLNLISRPCCEAQMAAEATKEVARVAEFVAAGQEAPVQRTLVETVTMEAEQSHLLESVTMTRMDTPTLEPGAREETDQVEEGSRAACTYRYFYYAQASGPGGFEAVPVLASARAG